MDDDPSLKSSSGMVLKPHNGITVLVLGILGLVVCSVCGVIAWVMGRKDLAHMDAGSMDPKGRDMTRAGMICGIIATALGIVGLVVAIVYIVVIVFILNNNPWSTFR